MKITEKEVLHVAHLARLKLDTASIDTFSNQIATILAYVEKLNQVDTIGVIPTSHAISLCNAFREDVLGEHLSDVEAVSNAPETENGYFIVPRLIS